MELSETILSLLTCLHGQSGGSERILELVKQLFVIQKDLGLQYMPELSSAVLSLLVVLIQSELEHDQLSVLKLLIFIVKWKSENGMFAQSNCAYVQYKLVSLEQIHR